MGDATLTLVPTPVDEAAPPRQLGRYVLLDELGAGGMGTVYSAWDRELERRIALKLLRRDDGALREAQAMARLSHPNVVTVHDAAQLDGRTAIAMELVQGRSLRAWLAQPRPWRAVLAVFRDAGRGLAAAHAAGLVHRDFKPENVLIGDDGGVRVADFGLATATTRSDAPAIAPSPRLLELSAHGGTPRYQAPEREPTSASDQYAFCVALSEALFGEHPAMPPHPRAATGRVPSRVRRAVKRGLAADPAARFPSMDALLAALAPRSRRYALLGAVALAAGLAIALRGGGETCARGSFEGTWDAAVRAELGAAFAATGRPYAGEVLARISRAFDARVDALGAMRRDVCEERQLLSPEVRDARVACLDGRRAQLSALTAVLAHADGAMVDDAVRAAHALPPVADCANPTAAPSPRSPAARAVAAELDRGQALWLAGKPRDAVPVLAAASEKARLAGDPALRGRALHLLGSAQMQSYDDRAAQDSLEEAAVVLASARDDAAVADALALLINAIGVGQSRFAEALALRPAAEAALVRAGDDPHARAKLDRLLGQALRQRGDATAALALTEQALALESGRTPPDDSELASLHDALALALKALGRYDEALAHERQAVAIWSRLEGPDNPDVGGLRINIANELRHLGRDGEARGELAAARAILERAYGPDHPDVATAIHNQGELAVDTGDLAAARALLAQALAIRERTLPAGHVAIASTLRWLGLADLRAGDRDKAEAEIRRAIAILEAKNATGKLADAWLALAEVLMLGWF